MRVILSTGAGRLHLNETAACLKEHGHQVRLVTGWIPNSKLQERLADLVGPLVGAPNLARRLAVRRTDGRLGPEDLRSCAVAEGICIVAMRLGDHGLIPRSAGQAITWSFFGWASRRHLRAADIFHVRAGAGWSVIRKAKRHGIAVVVDCSAAHPAFMKRAVGPHYERFGLRSEVGPETQFWRRVLADCEAADLLLVNSDFVKRTCVDEGFASERIHVAYLGVRDDFLATKADYQQRASAFRLLFTGGFTVHKGAHLLVEALELVRREGLEVELTVAGSMDEYDRIASRLPPHRPPRRLGVLPQGDLRSLFADSDAYVFPTLSEGCAKSAMEALGAGLPVITTEACGLPGQPGTHYHQIESPAPQAVAAAISTVARSEELRRALGTAGVELVSSRYTWRDYARTVSAAYEKLK